jgi:hypothetical protein
MAFRAWKLLHHSSPIQRACHSKLRVRLTRQFIRCNVSVKNVYREYSMSLCDNTTKLAKGTEQ